MRNLTLIGLSVLVVLAVSGCVGANTSSAAASSSSVDASASAESLASSEPVLLGMLEWPAESFGDLPEPKTTAEIIEVSTIDGGATVRYRGMKEAEVAAYVDAVKSLGYTESPNETKKPAFYGYSANRDNAGAIIDMVIISYEVDSEGVATTSISYAKG